MSPQSLPPELQSEIAGTPAGLDEQNFLGVNIADRLGLIMVGVKGNDRRLQVLEEENKRLLEENTAFNARLEILETKLKELGK